MQNGWLVPVEPASRFFIQFVDSPGTIQHVQLFPVASQSADPLLARFVPIPDDDDTGAVIAALSDCDEFLLANLRCEFASLAEHRFPSFHTRFKHSIICDHRSAQIEIA